MGAGLTDGVCLALALDAASKVTEQEWREKAKKDLEEWNLRQNEQMEKNRANNRYVGVSVAARAAMGAAVQPDLPSWHVWGASVPTVRPSPVGMELCQVRGQAPGLQVVLVAALAGTTEGSQWDLSASCPPRGPRIGAGLWCCLCSLAIAGRFSWCHVCCDEWVMLCGRTLTPSLFLSF